VYRRLRESDSFFFFLLSLLVEVAIHTILYVRQVYPADLFVRRKKYDTPVFQSRHPALNEYVSGAIKAIGEEVVLVWSASHARFATVF
jgi:hypothetical protein